LHWQASYTVHMLSANIRTFFACEFSRENLSKIEQLLAGLRSSIPQSVKWVDIKNVHLTLQFLGEFKKADVSPVQASLQKALAEQKPFALHIQKMGAFPSPSKPKIIWLGIEHEPPLFDLVKIVTGVTQDFGYPPEERPFSAHITLGRIKPYASSNDLAGIKNILLEMKDVEIGSQTIDRLYFIKSELTPAGPHYQELFHLPFLS
jgi:2'-5' RNA ligase